MALTAPTPATCQPVMPARLSWLVWLAFVICFAPAIDCLAEEGAASFVGGQVCAGCHQPEARLWQGSHHQQAMQEATAQTVLGDFDNAHLTHFGVTSTFFRKDGKFFVRTDGPDGALHDYEIAYTFGVFPLQQYLVAFPGGRYQVLPFGWDSRPAASGGQHWFHLHPDESIPAGDPLHWTGINQTWNFMCADCHSTNLRRNFDLATNSYRTTWSEIDVSCEACHGPGSQHVSWAGGQSGNGNDKGLVAYLADRSGATWQMNPAAGTAMRTVPRSSNMEIETCGLCHSRRYEIAGSFAYGHPLLDSAVPHLLEEGVYFSDGQIQEEDYEYGSFLQSRMFHLGVTCSNCHDPHSLKLRAPGNQVCAQCHLPAKFDVASHTHHQAGSAGAQCANCHMPTRTYMVVDARRDHAIRIPRPDLTASIGTPNACNGCHADRSAQWAADWIAKWFGPGRRVEAHYGSVLDAGRKRLPGADGALATLITDGQQSGIVRATAVSLLPQFSSDTGPEEIKAYLAGFRDPDPLVRMAAIDAMQSFDPAQRVSVVAPLLSDGVKAVRIAAARALASASSDGLTSEQQAAFVRASAELIESELATAERPESHVSIGSFEADRGNFAEAEKAYLEALRLDPKSAPAMVNLADLYRQMGRDDEAEGILRKAIAAAPDYAAAYHALGLTLVRAKQISPALHALQKAVILAPRDAQYAYVYAIALNSTGQPKDALDILRQAKAWHPANTDILAALVTISRDTGDRNGAINYAQELIRVAPNDPRGKAMLDSLGSP